MYVCMYVCMFNISLSLKLIESLNGINQIANKIAEEISVAVRRIPKPQKTLIRAALKNTNRLKTKTKYKQKK